MLRQDEPVQWGEETRGAVEVALNEADVLGVQLERSGAWCDLLLHVVALPEVGPLDRDPLRILRLTSPAQVRVLLRREQPGPDRYGPAITLADLDAVEDFFASLSWSGSMYGWEFLDEPSLTRDWPGRPSLAIEICPGAGSHSLFWFNECGREENGSRAAYCVEGTVTFEDLEVLRADGTPQRLGEFTADGHRYWEALRGLDERVSVEAQRAAQGAMPSWRPYARIR